ncbi:FmdB family zinc ribbon protein [Calderihabitans maritimus]|uniref:Putative regulatory protein FmdB zinc ribbon domain-containing protein n=1 Tax=Calderihabitans maritimus TaxID=1246530 RepID=A0A1Z5HU47_9FIRM|nr:zinc ribbon domain-containing protein [Calderihabitans maritimus]GAW93044.1 hypothetical protein Moth_0829 [Calderihabitans maritimus]
MPSYDFRCEKCGHDFTVRVSWREKDKVKCPVCGSSSVKQLFTSFTLLTGGSGGACNAPSGSPFG